MPFAHTHTAPEPVPQNSTNKPLMIWRDQFSTHIPSIDRQHKVIINHINKVDIAARKSNAHLELSHVLSGLISYTKIHFAYEEMLFRTFKYADHDDHVVSHTRLLEKVIWYKNQSDNKEQDIAKELLEFLIYWLRHHILEEDMAYSHYLCQKGAR